MLESMSASETLEHVLKAAVRDGLIVRYQTDWAAAAVLVNVTFPAGRYHRASAATLSRD